MRLLSEKYSGVAYLNYDEPKYRNGLDRLIIRHFKNYQNE